MLGLRKYVRIDRYDYEMQLYGGKKSTVIESFRCFVFVKSNGSRDYSGATQAQSNAIVVNGNRYDMAQVHVNDAIYIDGIRYKINAITERDRGMVELTCNADAR